MPGSNGIIRTAKLKCGYRNWIQATNVLYPLEISQEKEIKIQTIIQNCIIQAADHKNCFHYSKIVDSNLSLKYKKSEIKEIVNCYFIIDNIFRMND